MVDVSRVACADASEVELSVERSARLPISSVLSSLGHHRDDCAFPVWWWPHVCSGHERERERESVRQDRPNDPCGAGAIKKLEDRIQSAEQEIEVLGPEIAVSSTSVAPLN